MVKGYLLKLGMFVCAFLMLPLSLSAAPSFSCNGQLSSNERLLCKNSELGRLDRQIAERFHHLTSLLNRAAADLVRADQRSFIKQRQKCRSRFRCTRDSMRARLKVLTAELNHEQALRQQGRVVEQQEEGLSDEELDDSPCGPGFSIFQGKCIHNSELEQKQKIGNSQPLPPGKYGIYVLSHEDSLRLDATAGKLLYTQDKAGDRHAAKQSFFVVYQNGAYSITDLKSGLRLHADGGGDKQVSVRYQPHDDFTKFRLTPALDGCFHVQTVATGNYWVWEPNSQVIVVREQPAGEESMFCFMAQ